VQVFLSTTISPNGLGAPAGAGSATTSAGVGASRSRCSKARSSVVRLSGWTANVAARRTVVAAGRRSAASKRSSAGSLAERRCADRAAGAAGPDNASRSCDRDTSPAPTMRKCSPAKPRPVRIACATFICASIASRYAGASSSVTSTQTCAAPYAIAAAEIDADRRRVPDLERQDARRHAVQAGIDARRAAERLDHTGPRLLAVDQQRRIAPAGARIGREHGADARAELVRARRGVRQRAARAHRRARAAADAQVRLDDDAARAGPAPWSARRCGSPPPSRRRCTRCSRSGRSSCGRRSSACSRRTSLLELAGAVAQAQHGGEKRRRRRLAWK
jgi:hypothetical protein